MDIALKDNERIDNTGFGSLGIIQGEGFSYGVDSVLVAAFASGETGAMGAKASRKVELEDELIRIADLGSGNGIIPLILAHKLGNVKIMGIELDEDAYDRADRSVDMNDLGDKIRFINADIKDVYNSIQIDKLQGNDTGIEGAFDAVVTNPPYFRMGSGIADPSSAKARARHEITASLSDFLMLAGTLLRPQGDLYMVHRPDRLVDICCEMREAGIEPKEMQFVLPRAGEPANILLVHGVKGAGKDLRILSDIAVHTDTGYTDLIERIYERI